MAEISADDVRRLREQTGGKMMDCKNALVESGGSIDKAVELLRKKGLASAEKKAGREAKEGRVYAYIHHTQKVGTMVEVDCETDFVARNETFQAFVKELAMHITAGKAEFVNAEQVPADVLERERRIARESDAVKGKPAQVVDKIAEGKIAAYLKERVLLQQPWIHDDAKTVEQVVKELIAKVGENVVVRRFARFEIGGA
ncbi:MAG TPA: translation elongation factor Ts [Planctomycetota bacterium]|nr:translation elongation factor Ts [Planctomycetota bacterium]